MKRKLVHRLHDSLLSEIAMCVKAWSSPQQRKLDMLVNQTKLIIEMCDSISERLDKVEFKYEPVSQTNEKDTIEAAKEELRKRTAKPLRNIHHDTGLQFHIKTEEVTDESV